MTTKFIDLSGQRFGRLTVIGRSGSKYGKPAWSTLCDCGTAQVVAGCALRSGDSQSCGCLHRDAVTKHGAKKEKLYHTWIKMIARCCSIDNADYKEYGARGIAVCDRWRDGTGNKSGYFCFIEDMGPKPSPKHSLDRIDNDGNYEPGNVRWATAKVQVNNSRTVFNARRITKDGESLTISEWAARLGVSKGAIWYRLNSGMTDVDAVSI